MWKEWKAWLARCIALVAMLECLDASAQCGAEEDRSIMKAFATLDVYYDEGAGPGYEHGVLRQGGASPNYIGGIARTSVGSCGYVGVQVEQNYDPVKGQIHTLPIGDRHVTLDANGDWGTLRVGRQFTPHALFMGGDIDAFQTGFSGSALLILDGGASLISRTNAVFYQSPEIANVSTQLMIANDARRDNHSQHAQNGMFWQVARRTEQSFVEGILVYEHNLDYSHWRRLTALGGGFTAANVEWTGALQFDAREQGRRYAEAALGAKTRVGAHQVLFSVGWSHEINDSHGGEVIGVAYVYQWKSWINFYGSVAWLKNAPQSSFDFGHALQPGQAAADAMVGVRFRF